MSYESIINIVCSITSVLVTIIIGIFQIRQSDRMEKFERRQDYRDEKRHRENVHASACKFISKYYEQRGMIPLCAIASMYNDAYHYDRQIYSEFLLLNIETRKEIMKLSQFDLEIDEEINIFDVCLKEVDKCCKQMFPGDDQKLFYDHGKYIERALTLYGKNHIPIMPSAGKKVVFSRMVPYEFKDYVTDMMAYHKEEQPISRICTQYDFYNTDEERACLIAIVVAKYAAIYSKNEERDETVEYGSPGAWAGETLETMEDLFLSALFEIYINLVL